MNTSLEPKLRGSRRVGSLPSRPQKMVRPSPELVTKQLPPCYRHRWSITSHRHLKTKLFQGTITSSGSSQYKTDICLSISICWRTNKMWQTHFDRINNCQLTKQQLSISGHTPPPLFIRHWVIKRENLRRSISCWDFRSGPRGGHKIWAAINHHPYQIPPS